MTPTTTVTVWRLPPATAPAEVDGMVGAWDEDDRTTAGTWEAVVALWPAAIASPSRADTQDPSHRSEVDARLIAEGLDVRPGDEVVDDVTAARYRVQSVSLRRGFPGMTVGHVAADLLRVEYAAPAAAAV